MSAAMLTTIRCSTSKLLYGAEKGICVIQAVILKTPFWEKDPLNAKVLTSE